MLDKETGPETAKNNPSVISVVFNLLFFEKPTIQGEMNVETGCFAMLLPAFT